MRPRVAPAALPDLFRLSQYSYETRDEIHFVQYLGLWIPAPNRKQSRVILLQQYHEAMKQRQSWGDVDAVVVESAVITLLSEET